MTASRAPNAESCRPTAEQRLSNVLSEFARTLVTDFPIQSILDYLVSRIVEVMPVSGAGVTLFSPGSHPQYVAASNSAALRFEQLQSSLGEGPCLAAYASGEAVAVADLRVDVRFPRFAPRAVEAGLIAVFTFPLRQNDDPLGALDLYGDVPGPLDVESMAAAQTLADVATAYLLNAQARADLQTSSDHFRERSLHDPLTGLPNRVLLRERLQHAVQRARRSKRIAAILFADLDRFKHVNDLYGHQIGDELLVAVAERLTGLLRPGDTLARMSGDEFVILCEDIDDVARAETLAARIAKAMDRPYRMANIDLHVTASVGIAFAGPGDDIIDRVLQDADAAMYQAKRLGGAHHQVIDLRDGGRADQWADLEIDLDGAIARGELRLDYQPIVRTADGVVTGVEALVRWAHPVQGLLPPAVVIPLAERTGVITDLDRWVLAQACRDRHRWTSAGRPSSLGVSVNVSARPLLAPEFGATVERVLRSTGTDPAMVTLEITEAAFLEDAERAVVVLASLKKVGVVIALDDFGAGFSSLDYLKRFPIDVVKMDQHLVTDPGPEASSAAIASAVVGLAHALNLKVVAEGVENAEQHRRVTDLSCEASQGFYFARPMSAADLLVQIQRLSPAETLRYPARRIEPPLRSTRYWH